MNSKIELDVINSRCAGIDVGSRSHFVAISQNLNDVKEFGVYADDLSAISKWLKENEITSVAMESTGPYWQNLYVELSKNGFEVVLTNGKFTKQAHGKKTDVQDCQWIQKLHSLGLLAGSFLPDEVTEQLRTYCRQRTNWLNLSAETSLKMQKYLKLLNFRLDVVVKDICGLTGLAIIADICNGNHDPKKLAEHRHYNCRKSKEEIAKALKGNNRKDYLFGLKQEYESYRFFQSKIADCDKQIELFMKTEIKDDADKKNLRTTDKKYKKANKNAPDFDLNQLAFQYFGGIDFMAIEGVSHATILTLISEVGPDGFKKFPTAKHFTSWLRLAPNNKISGGRVLSRKTPKGSNRLKIGFRQAANAIGNLKDTHLSGFFRRIAFRKGRSAAISATARKLAVIIWNMQFKKQPYKPSTEYLFLDQKRHLKLVTRIRHQIAKLDLKPEQLGFATS